MPEYSLLLVDDEPNILSSLGRLLRRERYKLFTASNGDEALAIVDREKIDLIIADGRMPGLSGTELLQKVKAVHPEVVRIILSGYTDAGEVARAINEGEVYRFILKPWNDDELKITLRRALEHRRLMDENVQLYRRIKEQNEELKLLNANLEQVVEKKTRELVIRNRVLSLAQEILDQLPVAVIGVDATGTVVQANRLALRHFMGGGCVGQSMSPDMAENVHELVQVTIETGLPQVRLPRTRGSSGDGGCESAAEQPVSCFPLYRDGAIGGAVLIFSALAAEGVV